MADPGSFERHFHDRADLAERLYGEGFRNEAHLIATVALDSLGRVWAHDLPNEAPKGADAERFRVFVKKYADDHQVHRIAVVLFAQDLLEYGPVAFQESARRMLNRRNALMDPAEHMQWREWPYQHKDCDWEALLEEESSLEREPRLEGTAERYTYPALVYSLFRCGVAHTLLKGSRTHDFSGKAADDEISYTPPMTFRGRTSPIGIKFGLRVITGWVRSCASSYTKKCAERGIRPADEFDASDRAQETLRKAWKKLALGFGKES